MNATTTTQYTATPPQRSVSNNQSPQNEVCEQLQPVEDILDYVKMYARQKPGTAALWCFGVGFIVGWKLKPW
ncbi:MAG: hypothetical protein ABIK07_04240 [Planctomycetota bacterium]|jgi:hypothetical protein